jgi:hypothetical protein
MLASRAAKTRQGRALGLGAAVSGCEAQHDLVLARAREAKICAAPRPTLPRAATKRTSILEPFTVLRASLAARGPLRLARRLNSPRRRPN